MKTYDRKKKYRRRDGVVVKHTIPQRFRVALYDDACPERGWLAYDTRKLYYFGTLEEATVFSEKHNCPEWGSFSIFDRAMRRYIVPRPARRA